jgi:hypothetical protein
MDSIPTKLHVKCNQCNPKISPLYVFLHYDWSGFGGVIFATFPHASSCLASVLEGVPDSFQVTRLFHSLAQTPMFVL